MGPDEDHGSKVVCRRRSHFSCPRAVVRAPLCGCPGLSGQAVNQPESVCKPSTLGHPQPFTLTAELSLLISWNYIRVQGKNKTNQNLHGDFNCIFVRAQLRVRLEMLFSRWCTGRFRSTYVKWEKALQTLICLSSDLITRVILLVGNKLKPSSIPRLKHHC